MTGNDSERVEKFIDDIGSVNTRFHSILLTLREIFLESGVDLEEGIKYGGLVFSRDSKLIGGIYIYKSHLSIEFSQGADFDDPEGLLQGSGKFRRHLKYTSENDIQANQSEAFIKQACCRKSNCSA